MTKSANGFWLGACTILQRSSGTGDRRRKSMLEENNELNSGTGAEGAPRWIGLAMVVLAGISILGVGMAWNASSHEKSTAQALAEQNKDLQENVAALNQRLAQEEQS